MTKPKSSPKALPLVKDWQAELVGGDYGETPHETYCYMRDATSTGACSALQAAVDRVLKLEAEPEALPRKVYIATWGEYAEEQFVLGVFSSHERAATALRAYAALEAKERGVPARSWDEWAHIDDYELDRDA